MSVAQQIARRQMGGNAAGGLLNPKAPMRGKDHAKENVRAMREKAAKLRGQQVMQNCAPSVELFKMKQFADVKSRLNDPKALRRRLDGEDASKNAQDDQQAAGEGEIGLAEFERQVEEMIKLHGQKKPQNLSKDAAGVPLYLQKMKNERQEKQRLEDQQRNQPRVPAGYRIVPADEVKETLDLLQKKHKELETQFRNLPLKIETDGQKQRQKALMSKIADSEKAIAMFSKPTVMVEA
mmetsp:Transcript_30481/g.55258  ORF Transcript_30481/g.55258 Transcript_30481/m.55258 type:complete len:237 (+) Transcript_30481:69-779(+)|eukprot:CAMPEP_0197647194 /NCGR_PEP_ID=MMETSP1338-20131121/24488_1 /TAXON_ID=43686 ORGANISM="Pelagodinium beii, Strain RCC1491" /NCGR_SAMPLE_ID=MMETSP1338 /ASSEMBLY_ACC=CAM_ASM_000754 /LENGTH=236 /DNA_ID=CAMNT_0043220931 /DNA_START=69 /DNA_END=779 /DNA_ORIENTATION=-